MKTSYPELPFVTNPITTTLPIETAVHLLLDEAENECLARSVFGVMFAEASRTKDRNEFKCAGNYNYSGVQTDSGRWKFSDTIVNRFRKVDIGGKNREFAGFSNHKGFFDFMLNRIKAKGFDGCNSDNWTQTYIQNWWSPINKAQYTIGTSKFNEKKAIFNSAMKRFDQFKQTYKPKKKVNEKKFKILGLIAGGVLISFVAYYIYSNRNLLGIKK
jgi:hypothetical protein